MFKQAELKKLLNELLKNAPQNNSDVLKIKHLADGLLNTSEELTPEQVKVLAVIFLNGDDKASFFQKLEEALQISSKTISALHKKHGFFDHILLAAKVIWVLGDEDWVRKIENEYDLNGAEATENLLEDTTFTDGITNKINIFYEAFNKKKIPTQEIVNRVKSAQYNIDFCLAIINKENIFTLKEVLKNISSKNSDENISINEVLKNISSKNSDENISIFLRNYFMRLNSLRNKKEIMTFLNEKFKGISITEKHFVNNEIKEELVILFQLYKIAKFTDMLCNQRQFINLAINLIKKIYKHLLLEQLKEPIHDSIFNLVGEVLENNTNFIIGHYLHINFAILTSCINEIVGYSKKIKDNNPQYYEDIMKVAEGQASDVNFILRSRDLKNIIQVYSSWAKYRNDGKQLLDMPKGCYSGKGYYYHDDEKEYYSVGNLGIIAINFSIDNQKKETDLCVKLLVAKQNNVCTIFDKYNVKMPEIKNGTISFADIKIPIVVKLIEDNFPVLLPLTFFAKIFSEIKVSKEMSQDEQELMYRVFQEFEKANKVMNQSAYPILSKLADLIELTDFKKAIKIYNGVIKNSNDSELIEQCKMKLLAIVNSQKIENLEIETIACLFERLPSGSNGFEMIMLVHKTNEDFYKKLWIFKNVITIFPNASFSGKIHEELFNLYNVIRFDEYDEDSKEKAQIENQCIFHLIKSKNKDLIDTVLSGYAGFNESQQRALTDLVDGEVDVLLREIETTLSEEKTVSPFSSNQCFYPRHLKKEDNKNSVTKDEEFSPISISH